MKFSERYSKFKGFIWRSKLSTVSWVLLIIGTAIGLLLTAQWRTLPTRASDPIVSYVSLESTQKDLLVEKDNLRNQIKTLQDKIDIEQNDLKKFKTSKDAVDTVQQYEKQVGLTDVTGQGVIIIMNDAPKLSDSTLNSITHAADLRDIVNLLWGAGASAININDERIVFTTSIDCIVNTILINTTKTTPPFIIKAIGDKEKLYNAATNKENLKDIYKRVKSDGLIFDVAKNDSIEITAFKGSFDIKYAKIIN